MRINLKHIATFRRLERNIWRQYLGARCGKRPGGRGKSRCEENLPISVLKMANFDQNRTFHFLGAMRPGRQWTAWSKTIVTINIHQHFGRSCTANISTYCQYFGVRLAICNIHISGDPKQLICQSLVDSAPVLADQGAPHSSSSGIEPSIGPHPLAGSMKSAPPARPRPL